MDASILDQSATFDPAAGVEATARIVPARWAVYLFADADNRPIQLLCVKNLRASVRRRLSGLDPETPTTGGPPVVMSKKIDYPAIVRKLSWRRVDSAFEADLVYLEAARKFFPNSYSTVAGLRPAWFIHVDLEAPTPRYVRTTDLSEKRGDMFGPFPDRSAAGAMIEKLEDWFDLCRYHDVLNKSPLGRACAYKEMGRCPAPCDGSVSLDAYRQLVAFSIKVMTDQADFLRGEERRMAAAAAELKFESAAKIKLFVESLNDVLGRNDFRHVRRLRDFRYVSLQAADTAGGVKVFLITPSGVEQIARIDAAPVSASTILRDALHCAETRPPRPDAHGIERMGVVTHHLFSRKQSGVFLPLEEVNDRTLEKAYRDVQKQRSGLPEKEDAGEGVQKELLA